MCELESDSATLSFADRQTAPASAAAGPAARRDRLIGRASLACLLSYCLTYAASAAVPKENPLYWAPYLVPLMFGALLWYLRGGPGRNAKYAVVGLAAYAVVAALSLMSSNDSYLLQRDLVIFSIFFAMPLLGLKIDEKTLAIFAGALTLTGLLVVLWIQPRGNGAFDLVASKSPTEAEVSVALGAMFLAALSRGWKVAAAIAALGCLITFKRNAWGAALVALAPLAAYQIVHDPLARKTLRKAAVGAAIVVALAFPILYGSIFQAVINRYFPGFTLEQISIGRYPLYQGVIAHLERFTPAEWVFGGGPGTIERMIVGSTRLSLTHNETFHFIGDYGLLGLGLYLAFVTRSLSKTGNWLLAFYVLVCGNVENMVFVHMIMLPLFMVGLADFPRTGSDRGTGSRPHVVRGPERRFRDGSVEHYPARGGDRRRAGTAG